MSSILCKTMNSLKIPRFRSIYGTFYDKPGLIKQSMGGGGGGGGEGFRSLRLIFIVARSGEWNLFKNKEWRETTGKIALTLIIKYLDYRLSKFQRFAESDRIR